MHSTNRTTSKTLVRPSKSRSPTKSGENNLQFEVKINEKEFLIITILKKIQKNILHYQVKIFGSKTKKPPLIHPVFRLGFSRKELTSLFFSIFNVIFEHILRPTRHLKTLFFNPPNLLTTSIRCSTPQ